MPDADNLPHWSEPAFLNRPGGYRLAWFELGAPTGRPLLLCHGLAASSLQFADDAKFFAEQGFRVIVPDLRGHGRSTCPSIREDADFSISTLADDLLALLNHLEIEQIDWVGNSLGGILALYIIGQKPERLRSLATYGTAFSLNVPDWIVPMGKLTFGVLGPKLTAAIGGPMTTTNKKAQPLIAKMLRDMDFDAVMRTGKAVLKYDMIEYALRFERSILIMRGAKDAWVNTNLPATLKAMQNHPDFTLVELEDAGHVANQDQPEVFRQHLLAFLARV